MSKWGQSNASYSKISHHGSWFPIRHWSSQSGSRSFPIQPQPIPRTENKNTRTSTMRRWTDSLNAHGNGQERERERDWKSTVQVSRDYQLEKEDEIKGEKHDSTCCLAVSFFSPSSLSVTKVGDFLLLCISASCLSRQSINCARAGRDAVVSVSRLGRQEQDKRMWAL